MSNEPTLDGIVSGTLDAPPIMIRTRRKTIVPRSAVQVDYMRALARDDIIFALGPGGHRQDLSRGGAGGQRS